MHINCTRRHFMCALGLGALGIVSPRKLQGSEVENKRPNVLFIAVDDLRTSLGCYGDRLAETPHIDKLVQSGLLFTRAYCHQAVCGPSRVSMLTGRLPDKTSVWHFRNLFREKHPDLITLPQLFKNNGYHAQSMGKVFSGNSREEEQDPQSWPVPPLLIGNGWQKISLPENETNGRKGPATEYADVPDEANCFSRAPAPTATWLCCPTELSSASTKAAARDRTGRTGPGPAPALLSPVSISSGSWTQRSR